MSGARKKKMGYGLYPVTIKKSPREITLGSLLEFHQANLEADGKSEKTLRNHASTMRRLARDLGLTMESEASQIFSEAAAARLSDYIDSLPDNGGLAQYCSEIRSIQSSYSRQVKAHGLPATFPEALKYLCSLATTEDPFGPHRLGRIAGVSRHVARGWIYDNRIPSRRNADAVRRMEKHFGLAPGTLLNKCGLAARTGVTLKKRLENNQGTLTDYNRRHRERVELPYRLSREHFPARLKAELGELIEYKTALLAPRGLERRTRWRESTADRFVFEIEAFYGWALLPKDAEDARLRGPGFSLEQLRLPMLVDPDMVMGYVEFIRTRSGGIYHSGHQYFLSTAESFVHPDTGFFPQSQSYRDYIDGADWIAWCEASKAYISRLRKAITPELQKSRDPLKQLAPIIALTHPIDALFGFADALEEHYRLNRPTSSPVSNAVAFRNLFLVKLMTAAPLRVKNIAAMTWNKDNTGHLRRAEDGWWLHYEPKEFKNTNGAAKGSPYHIRLPKQLESYIEEYLYEHRPHLAGAAEGHFVFRPRPQNGVQRSQESASEPWGNISSLIERLSGQHFPFDMTIRPHAFRHIVASEYIKNRPDGFDVAARVLHDKPETVRRDYAHLSHQDYITHWHDYLDEQFSRRENSEDEAA